MPIRKRAKFSDQQAATWDKTLQQTLGVLKRLPTRIQPHGGIWVDGMRRYYSERLMNILKFPPPGRRDHAKRVLAAYRRAQRAN